VPFGPELELTCTKPAASGSKGTGQHGAHSATGTRHRVYSCSAVSTDRRYRGCAPGSWHAFIVARTTPPGAHCGERAGLFGLRRVREPDIPCPTGAGRAGQWQEVRRAFRVG